MELFSQIALVLLTLSGYSAGAALAGRDRPISPSLSDALLVLLLSAGALASRNVLGRWQALGFGSWLAVWSVGWRPDFDQNHWRPTARESDLVAARSKFQ